MKKYYKALAGGALFVFLVLTTGSAQASTLFSQPVTLTPGWNIVSTPRVLESHSFSAAETSDNFDIFVLDASSTAGWTTMAQEGQTDFTPLFGYFVNNKSASDQTLTFNYKDLSTSTVNESLFSRKFSTSGWYSIGVANSSYAVPVGSTPLLDKDNIPHILAGLTASGANDITVDFTDSQFPSNPDAVGVGSTWKAVSIFDEDTLNDFRETKGYAVHLAFPNGVYGGFQNNNIPTTTTPLVAFSAQNASSTTPQNVAINVANMPLGGFTVNTDHALEVQSLIVHFNTSVPLLPLQNVSLVSDTGSTIAGPFNAVCDGSLSCTSTGQTVTFLGPILFPAGSHTFNIKGQIQTQSGIGNATIQASTNPSTEWSTVTDQTTNTNVRIGVTNFTMSTMTVQSAALAVSNGSSPTSQSIVSGGQNIQFATINLDASQSGEDVRISSLPLQVTFGSAGSNTDLTNCQIMNGAIALNTGSRVVNSAQIPSPISSTTPSQVIFSFDNSLTIAKGSVVSLALECNVGVTATTGATYSWAASTNTANYLVSGAISGITVAVPAPTGVAPIMTVSAGASVTAVTDSSSPNYFVAAGGTTGVTLNVVKLRATNEALNLQKLGLNLTGNTGDVTQASIYSGNNVQTSAGVALAPNTLLGTMIFSGAQVATSTLNQVVRLPVNQDATLIIKADLADIGTSQPGVEGDLVKLDFDSARGVGVSSGSTVDIGSAGLTPSAGVRVFNTFPVLSLGTGLSSGGVSDGNLMRFVITPDSHGPVGLNKVTFTVTPSSGTTVAGVNLFAYTDSNFSQPANTGSTGGVVGSTVLSGNSAVTTIPTPLEVSSPMYFQLTGTVSPTGTTYNVNTNLLGDSVSPTSGPGGTAVDTASVIQGTSNFVWSPNATGTAATTDADWTNGTGLQGLPSIGLTMNRTQ